MNIKPLWKQDRNWGKGAGVHAPLMFPQGGRPPLLGIENYYNSPAVIGPSGFQSKHLNFFFRRYWYAVYWVIISIFRKCHLGNLPQIHFKDITEMKCIYRSTIKRKISFKDMWFFCFFLTIFFELLMAGSPNFATFHEQSKDILSKKSKSKVNCLTD